MLAEAEVPNDDQYNRPQCRICLDGPDPALGRLIRPCLCSGTVSVRHTPPPPHSTAANPRPIRYLAIISMYTWPASNAGGTLLPTLLPFLFVRSAATITASPAPRLSALLPIQVSSPRLYLVTQFHPTPSRNRNLINRFLHGHSLRVVFPDDHFSLFTGRTS
jgi:hypothetical protein